MPLLSERKIRLHQLARIRGILLCHGCGSNMFVAHATPDTEERAVCYNKACEYYRVTFTVEWPTVLLVKYADTKEIEHG